MSTTTATTELSISGMTCASCAAGIEKKLNKLDGVTATVNFATEKAHVEYGDDITSHVGDAERAGWQVAEPAAAVVHQDKPEMAPQLPRDRVPSVAVETHPLDEN